MRLRQLLSYQRGTNSVFNICWCNRFHNLATQTEGYESNISDRRSHTVTVPAVTLHRPASDSFNHIFLQLYFVWLHITISQYSSHCPKKYVTTGIRKPGMCTQVTTGKNVPQMAPEHPRSKCQNNLDTWLHNQNTCIFSPSWSVWQSNWQQKLRHNSTHWSSPRLKLDWYELTTATIQSAAIRDLSGVKLWSEAGVKGVAVI